MPKWSVVAVICSMLLVVVVFAQEAPEPAAEELYELIYAPEFGATATYQMKADVLDVTLQDSPMGITAEGSAKVKMQFAPLVPAGPGTKVTVTLTYIKGSTPSEQHSLTGSQVVTLTVDEQARIVAYEIGQRVAPSRLSAGANALAGLTVRRVLPLLPPKPVAIGPQWERQMVVHLPGAGAAMLNITSRLASWSPEQIVIESSSQGTLPEIEAPNPLVPGQMMTVANAKVAITRLRQVCDPQTLVVLTAEGAGSVKFDDVTPDYTLPLGVQMKFKLTPPTSTEQAQ